MFKRKSKEPWTILGTGVHLDHPNTILELGFPDSYRKGHFWCFGTTRVGKTRVMEHIIEQDIRQASASLGFFCSAPATGGLFFDKDMIIER